MKIMERVREQANKIWGHSWTSTWDRIEIQNVETTLTFIFRWILKNFLRSLWGKLYIILNIGKPKVQCFQMVHKSKKNEEVTVD